MLGPIFFYIHSNIKSISLKDKNGRDDIEKSDSEAADTIRIDISISKRYIDIFDVSK